MYNTKIAGSSNGRTPAFEAVNPGSSPGPASIIMQKYSQNFIKSDGVVHSALRKSDINENDIVIDLGAGEGIITKALSNRCKNVIAVENDKELVEYLNENFKGKENVKIFEQDILKKLHLKNEYKIFANIPFNYTSRVIDTYLSDTKLQSCYLFLQKEAAIKYAGLPFENESYKSIILKNSFDIDIIHRFHREDFIPQPNINIVLIEFIRKQKAVKDEVAFKDFVAYIFTNSNPSLKFSIKHLFTNEQIERGELKNILKKYKRPTELEFHMYQYMYLLFEKHAKDVSKKKVLGYAKKINKESLSLKKIYRTRKDKDWHKK